MHHFRTALRRARLVEHRIHYRIVDLGLRRSLRLRLEAERRQFDPSGLLAEHDDAAGVAFLAGSGELEAVLPGQAQLAALVAAQAQPAQGDVLVQQLDALPHAMLLHQQQRALADAMGTPPPGGDCGQQHECEKVAQSHFQGSAPG
ncbi:hypothetical protein D3C78_1198120 [compost metagenome]